MITVNLYGAGGHCRSLLSCLNSGSYSVESIFDEEPAPDEEVMGVPVKTASQTSISGPLILAVGNNFRRKNLYLSLSKLVYTENIAHRFSYQDTSAYLGKSNQFLYGSYVGPSAILGENNIINTNAVIEHEVEIGSHCHIAVGAKILGRAKVGNNCFICAGAIIRDGVSISDNVVIGANSFVNRDIHDTGTYVGLPAKRVGN